METPTKEAMELAKKIGHECLFFGSEHSDLAHIDSEPAARLIDAFAAARVDEATRGEAENIVEIDGNRAWQCPKCRTWFLPHCDGTNLCSACAPPSAGPLLAQPSPSTEKSGRMMAEQAMEVIAQVRHEGAETVLDWLRNRNMSATADAFLHRNDFMAAKEGTVKP
jgi:hypothetical protein